MYGYGHTNNVRTVAHGEVGLVGGGAEEKAMEDQAAQFCYLTGPHTTALRGAHADDLVRRRADRHTSLQ